MGGVLLALLARAEGLAGLRNVDLIGVRINHRAHQVMFSDSGLNGNLKGRMRRGPFGQEATPTMAEREGERRAARPRPPPATRKNPESRHLDVLP
jgi:hypothetical protein